MWDGPPLSAYLLRDLGVKLKVRQCQRLVRQLGSRLRKPRPQVAQADPQMQTMHKKLRRLARRADVDLWAMDEVHSGSMGLAAACGFRPRSMVRYVATRPYAKAPAFLASCASVTANC